MKKLHIDNCKNILTRLIVLSFIILATASVIYYAKGYRINFVDQKIIKTGVLSLETQPRRAHFYLTEDFSGRTSRTISSIPAGTYNLDIWMNGYHDLTYEIEIIAERSTPISAFLYKKFPEHEIVSILDREVIISHKDKSSSTVLLLLKDEGNVQTEYQILKYQTNLRFWQLKDNLQEVFEFSTHNENSIESFSISPNNNFAVLAINGENEGDLSPGTHILSLENQKVLTSLDSLNEDAKWSKDSLFLIWLEEENLVRLSIEELGQEKLVYEKTEEIEIIYYDTDSNGDVYLLYRENENIYVSLAKIDKNGNKTQLLEKIYYQEEERFLEPWKDKKYIDCPAFKNSPQSTLLVGQPKDFWISLETKTIILKTEYAAYRYNIEKDRYTLINPYPTEILNFSPDNRKLTFLDIERKILGTFTFDKEAENLTGKLGTHYIADNIEEDSCSDFAWHSNSENIYYVCASSLYAVDIRGFNNILILPYFGNHILLENNGMVSTLLTYNDLQNSEEILEKLAQEKQKTEFEEILKHINETNSVILELTVN